VPFFLLGAARVPRRIEIRRLSDAWIAKNVGFSILTPR